MPARKSRKPSKYLRLELTDDDIAAAVCGNRRRCVLAKAIDRQLGLGGLGYIKVDAAGVAYTNGGRRRWYALPQPAVTMLRDFDDVGQKSGMMAARAMVVPGTCFRLTLVRDAKIPPKASRERMNQINTRRNKVAEGERAQGIIRRPRPRFTGT